MISQIKLSDILMLMLNIQTVGRLGTDQYHDYRDTKKYINLTNYKTYLPTQLWWSLLQLSRIRNQSGKNVGLHCCLSEGSAFTALGPIP